MKLISCKIENFGMLQNAEHHFDAPLHVVMAENGAGKSTLAAFLKAMLYGLSGKGRSIEDNERKRYLPWQGGRFGGTLTFSAGGNTYRLERFFGKTPKDDTFALYDAETNLASTAYSADIGEALFGIDAAAFARTTFFTWKAEEKTEANNSIHAKLNDLSCAADDIGDFDAAIDRLDAERKLYEKRGGHGALSDLEEEIYQCTLSMGQAAEAAAQLEKTASAYAACEKEKEATEAALAALRAENRERQKTEARRGIAMQLAHYEDEINACDAAMHAAEEMLGATDTPKEVFAHAMEEAEAAYRAYTLACAKAEDCQKEISLTEETLAQAPDLPDEDTLRAVSDAVMAYEALAATQAHETSTVTEEALRAANDTLHEAEAAFDAYRTADGAYRHAAEEVGEGDVPLTEAHFSDARMRVQALRTLEKRVAEEEMARETARLTEAHQRQKQRLASTVCTVLGALLLTVGVMGIVFLPKTLTYLVPAIAVCAIAAILLVGGIVGYARGKQTKPFAENGTDTTALERERIALDTFFSSLGLHMPSGTELPYEVLLERLSERIAAQKECRYAKAEREETGRKSLEQAAALRRCVTALCGVTFDASHSVAAHLAWARAELAKLEATSGQAEAQQQRCRDAEAKAEASLKPYAVACGATPMARLSALREAVAANKGYRKQCEELHARKNMCDREATVARAKVEAFIRGFACADTEDLADTLQNIGDARRALDEAAARKTKLVAARAQLLVTENITEDGVPALLALRNAPMTEESTAEDAEAALLAAMDEHKTGLYQMEAEMARLRESADALPYLEARKASLTEALAKATHTRDLIALTKGFLEGAKTELSTRYLRTMEASFLQYFRLVAPARGEGIAIDAELVPHVEVGGTRYPVEAFSHGLRDLLGLCMRLALTDAMYEESAERPPLILDDPFVNLDKEKLTAARALLDILCEKYQILYFTCHESRVMR